MKVQEFISQVTDLKRKHRKRSDNPVIWEQLNELVKQYCAEYRINKGKHGVVDRDEMDRHVVSLMERVLNMNFTKERVLWKKRKYELTMILLGYIPDIVKNKLEEKITPFTASIFVKFGLEIYPERDTFFYCYPQKICPVKPIIFEFIPKYIPPPEELYYHRLNLNDQLVEYLIIDIRDNPVLKVIGLQDNNIGPYGIERLFSVIKDHPSIEKVELMGNPITDIGVMHIANVLQECRLKVLSLNRGSREDATEIRSPGAVTLARALSNNQTVTYLGMGYNQIGDEGAEAFAKHLLSRYVPLDLRLSGNNICSQKAGRVLLKLVRRNCFITGMDLDGNEQLDSTIVKMIQEQVKDNFKTYMTVSEASAVESSNLVIKKVRKIDKDLANRLQDAIDEYFRCQKDVVQTPEQLQANCNGIMGNKISDSIMMFKKVIADLMNLYAERSKLYSTEEKFEREERLFRCMEWTRSDIEISEPPTNLQDVQQILPKGDKAVEVMVNFKGNFILCLPQNWAKCSVKIFGNIHGNVVAVDEIANFLKVNPNNKVICLGNYVDRGDSLGVLERLAAIRADLDDPSRLVLLRGNHEQAHLTPKDDEFSDALYGNFHRELIRGNFEQEIRVTDQMGDRHRCTIPLYKAGTICDRARLAEVSRTMFQSMPLGCFLPVADGKAILLSHGASFSVSEGSSSLFEELADVKKLLAVYSECANRKKLVSELIGKLAEAGCTHLVCGYSHLIGSYSRTGRFRSKSTIGCLITVYSALFSCDAEMLYAWTLMIEKGQIQKKFVEIPRPCEEVIMDAMCCVGLENAAKNLDTSRFDLTNLLALTHLSHRQHRALYAMIKAVQVWDTDLAIDIGRVYLSTLKDNYLIGLNSLIAAFRESKLSNSAINRVEKGLKQSILLEQPRINVIKGPRDNVIIRFPNLNLTKLPISDLSDSGSMEELQWYVEHSMQKVFQNMKAEPFIPEQVLQLKDGIGIDAVSNLISNVLCGIEKPDESPTVTVKSILNAAHSFRVLYSVPVAEGRGTLQFCVAIQQNVLTTEDITVNIEQSAVTHLRLMPKIINWMLQRVTNEINKELMHAGRRINVANLQRFNKSFISITRYLLGEYVSINMRQPEFTDSKRNSIKIQFELMEPNKFPILGVYNIYLVSAPNEALRVDAIELGFQDRGRDNDARPSVIVGSRLGKDLEDRSESYSYLCLFSASLPLYKINLRRIGKKLQKHLRSRACIGDNRITTEIFFNGSSKSLKVLGNRDDRLEQGGKLIIKDLEEQFKGWISDSTLLNAVIFIITDNESGAYALYGEVISNILLANGFMASFPISEYRYFINTVNPKEITIKFEVSQSKPLCKLDQSEERVQGMGYIEFRLDKFSEKKVDITCTCLEFKTDPSTIVEYETYRTSETISNMLQTSIIELNAVISEIRDIKSVKHINSCVTCFIKIGEMEEEVEFAQFFRDKSRDNIDHNACIRYLRERGIYDPIEQAHFVILLSDKSSAILHVYGSVMQKIIKELISESYLYTGKSGTKVTYNVLEKVIEVFCPFRLHKDGTENSIKCFYNIRIVRSPNGTLSLDKVELGIGNKHIARRIGRELEKSLEYRSDSLYYVTILSTLFEPEFSNVDTTINGISQSVNQPTTSSQQVLECPSRFFHRSTDDVTGEGNQASFDYSDTEKGSSLCP